MKLKTSNLFIIVLSLLFTWISSAQAELEIETVYPTLGSFGSPLSISIQGTGFDGNTRLSMALDVGNNRFVVGSVGAPSSALDVVVAGNLAYVAYGPDKFKQTAGPNPGPVGLMVVDITDPLNPVLLSTTPMITKGLTASLALSYPYVFIAGGENRLRVFDVSNPAQPQPVGNGAPLSGDARDITIVGNRAYVADWVHVKNIEKDVENSLSIINISNPASLTSYSLKLKDLRVQGLAVKGSYAYVTGLDLENEPCKLVVVDVSNPASMQAVYTLPMVGIHAYGITIVDDLAYIASEHTGVQVVDISNPYSPAIDHSVNTSGRAQAITFSDQRAYVADNTFGVTVLDVMTDPANIETVGTVKTNLAQTWNLNVKGEYAYVAGGDDGLQVVDITAPAAQQVISWVPTPGVSQFFERKGDYIYLGDGGGGFQVIDVSDPESPFIAGSAPTIHRARHVDVVGDIAYIADQQGGLLVADINDPEDPQIIGNGYKPALPRWTRYVTVSEEDDIAFLANLGRLILVDVSNPYNPTLIREVTGFSNIDGIIALRGNYAYVPDRDDGSVKVVDFSTPASAFIVKRIDVVPGDTDNGPRAVSLVGNRAYVANGDHGLCILDISNPANPIFNPAWSIELSDRAFFVRVIGSMAYVADGRSGIQIVDASDPASMYVIGNLSTAGEANCLAISGNIAFVGDFGNGFIVVPLPMEITPITVVNANKITCTLPSPTIPGHYNLKVFSGIDDVCPESLSDPPCLEKGAVTFSEDVKNSKAIIIAGGNYSTNQESKLEDEFQEVANEAYKAFLYQGFRKDDIQYLGPDLSVDDVDALNTRANIDWAFTTWAPSQSPHDIYVYLVGHGSTGYYKPNQERMLADEVKSLVAGLKSVAAGDVIFIYEACQSGAFLLNMDQSPGNSPVVITSSRSNQESWFYDLGDGLISFSSGFWESVMSRRGAKLDKAFSDGKDKVKVMQTAWMDTNGDLLPNTDLDSTEIVVVGRGYQPGKGVPIIGNVSASLSLNGAESATIWAAGIAASGEDNDIGEVFALITPPCYNPIPSIPGTVDDLDKVVLNDANVDGVYEGIYDNFSISGTYVVTVYARDTEGRLSDPREMYVYQNAGQDEYEIPSGDNTYLQAKEITLNDNMAQCRNFFAPGDEDWIKFIGLAGQIYLIEASNLGPDNNVVIEVFDTDGTTLLTQKDNPDNARADEGLYWRCVEEGQYFARIRPAGPENTGRETDYRLEIYRPVAELIGFITGTVKDSAGDPVEKVTLKTDAGASGISKEGGGYLLVHRAGNNFKMTMKANGYKEKNIPGISVEEAKITNINANLETVVVDTEPTIAIVSPNGNVAIFEGESVNFQSSTTNGNAPFTYAWDFSGGAANTTDENPGDVTFASEGEYSVSVTVEDDDKDSKTSESVTVSVNKNLNPASVPDVSISSPAADVTIVAGQAVNFQASLKQGNAPFDYAWDFSGGAANLKVEDPGDVIFTTPGTYTVNVTVEDNEDDQDIAEVTVTVVADLKPVAVIQSPASDVAIDMGAAVNFQGFATSGNPPIDYTWNFDGAALTSTVKAPGSVTFAVPGTYTVTFTVKDTDGDVHNDTVTITVNRTNGGGGGGGGGGGCFLSTILP